MTGKTHRAGGVLCSVVGFSLLKSNDLLLADVNQALQFLVVYTYCYWGSSASDLDHNEDSIPSKDLLSRGINKALHLTTKTYKRLDEKLTSKQKRTNKLYKFCKTFSASHRSWQTHSDLTFFTLVFLLSYVLNGGFSGIFGTVDVAILSLILTGVSLGLIAHFILDMLTPEGVHFLSFKFINRVVSFVFKKRVKILPEKVHFVPKWKMFRTDSDWEDFVLKVVNILTTFSVVGLILQYLGISLSDLIPYTITFTSGGFLL